ncbi:MAG TPA: aminoglycoside phosphotransferase family protein [Thermoanaerobaculia bacterium]|nr:aminoglycoside phosphotransferase family protein [Thermoanaerobaculia bacterium]
MATDAALVSDDQLPGLAAVLDPPALASLLERHLRRHDPAAEVPEIRILDVQYSQRRAAVLVRAYVRCTGLRRTARQKLFLHVVPPEEGPPAPAARLLARYQDWRRAATPRLAPMPVGALTIPDLGIAAYAFPLDPELTSLVDVTDPLAMRVAVNELWRRRGVKVRRVRVETLAYTPGSRAALRYEVLSESRDNGLPEIRHLVGKLQQRKSPATLFAGHWAVWRATAGRIRLAPPVGYLATFGMSLQEVVRGTRLSDVTEHGALVKGVRQAARAIATVHSLDLPLLATRGADKEVRSVRRWIDVLRRIRPALDGRLERLEARLVAELEARVRKVAPMHSDFHLANVLVDAEGVVLIDWDQVAVGDPASDVGRFLGALRVSALRATGRIDGYAELGEAFLTAYLATRPEEERQIQLFEACGLVVAAASPFRLQRRGWEDGADAMVGEAERLLAQSVRRPAAPPAAASRSLPEAARIRWALDPVYAQALLVPLARTAHGDDLEIYRCRPERVSAEGNRLRVRWRLSGLRGEERWKGTCEGIALSPEARSGVLRRLAALLEALGDSADALLLPRPLGFLEPLGLAVFEPSWPAPPAPLALASSAGHVERALGRGLGVVQTAAVDLGRSRTADRELRTVSRRLATLEEAGLSAATRCARLLAAVVELLGAAAPAAPAPMLRGLHLRELQQAGERIGVLAMRDVVAGPRPVTVAGLLAELNAAVDDADARREAAAGLRSGWLAATGAQPDELRPFEALALVRHGVDGALRSPADAAMVERHAAAAEEILGI